MLKRTIAVLAFLVPAVVAAPNPHTVSDVWGSRSALSFERNAGQTASGVRYIARTGDGILFFTDAGITFSGGTGATGFELVGANPQAAWEPLEATGETTSYRIGRDSSRWVDSAQHYRRLARHNVYPGIDLVYYGKGNRLEYDFQLAPHADPSQIRLRFPGAGKVAIALDGALTVATPNGPLRHEKPVIFETLEDGSRREVPGRYRLLGGAEAGFLVEGRDAAAALSIDPVIDSSTFFGGSAEDSVIAANSGAIIGNTSSIDVPGAAFARRAGTCFFVQSNGQTTVYGGSGDTVVTSVSFGNYDDASYLVVGGYTSAPDLPTVYAGFLVTAWQADFAGGATDGFVFVSSAYTNRPNQLFTYIGTPGDDKVTAVGSFPTSFVIAGTTNGRGLPASSTPIFQGVPSDQAAGIDGFYIAASAGFPYNVAPYTTAYFGGSGDDTPRAALESSTAAYLTGETTSPDFPVTAGRSTLNGTSDAFLMRLPSFGSQLPAPGVSILFGGSATDSGTAINALNDGTVVVAGVTASSDLPLQNAAQSAPGGGASDGFLAMFAPDLSPLQYATYLGGSGADQPTAIATNFLGGILVGGWTSSQDFPVLNALQPQYRGGSEDGFLAHYDALGVLQDATYFGGSGSDRILGVSAVSAPDVTVAGQTTSADLPTRNATQTNLLGGSDGFVAHITSTTLYGKPAVSAKDLRTPTSIHFGVPSGTDAPTITIESSDSSIVQVAANQTDPGQPSVQIAASGTSVTYYVDCLVENGTANLTLSAPGYTGQTVQATCRPASVNITYKPQSSYLTATSAAPLVVPAGGPTGFTFSLYFRAPVLGTTYPVGPRPGAGPVQAQISSSNPAVGSFSPSSLSFFTPESGQASPATFTPGAAGTTQITFSGPASIDFSGVSPLTLTTSAVLGVSSSYTVPYGFERRITVGYSPADSKQQLTVTSQDPNALLLSTDAAQTGTPSVTFRGGTLVLQALTAGDIGMTFTTAGQDPVTSTAHIVPPAVWFPSSTPLPQPVSLPVGQNLGLYATIGTADSPGTCCFSPNPGSNIDISVTASDPSVVNITPATVSVQTPQPAINVTGTAAGTATLSVQSTPSMPLASSAVPVVIAVKSKPYVMRDVEVGNNLVASMQLVFPMAAPTAGSVHLVSSDPALVLLSPDYSSPGRAQLDIAYPVAKTGIPFYVYGLAASGSVQITATVAGTSVTANVNLLPSGVGWTADTYSADLYNLVNLPTVAAFALDRNSLLPVSQQWIRPGQSVTVPLSSSNSDVLSLSSASVTLSSAAQPLLQGSSKSAGTATLSLTQLEGYATPSIRQNLAVTIKTPSISAYSVTVGKNLQVQFRIQNALPPDDLPLTVTSGDPSRLLISSDSAAAGSASATSNIRTGKGIFLQALDDKGSVEITLSMPGFKSSTVSIPLVPSGIGLTISSSSTASQYVNGVYVTTTQSPATVIQAVPCIQATPGWSCGGTLRAGLSPLPVEIASSDPTVASISSSPLSVVELYQQAGVSLTPLKPGTTQVSVTQPPGLVAVPTSSLTFRVTAPVLAGSKFYLARDTVAPVSAGLGNNVKGPAAPVTVTLTSSDPSALLLSPDLNTAPSASITRTLAANRTALDLFYVHALKNSGTVSIAIDAAGYDSAPFDIALCDLSFRFSSATSPVRLQNGPQTVSVAPVVVSAGVPAGYSTTFQPTIRPGVTIPVGVTSSDPGTVTVDTAQLVFTGGQTSMTATYRPRQVGTATLSLDLPAPYPAPATAGQLAVTVTAAPLSFSYDTLPLGRDLQTQVAVSAQFQTKPDSITIETSDSSRVLLSPDGKSAGQPSISLNAKSGLVQFYIQALTDAGAATLTASAPGYQAASMKVTLSSSAAVFTGTSQLNLFTISPAQQIEVALATLDPATLQPRYYVQPRPGVNLAVTVASSDPGVVSVDPQSIVFNVPDPANPPRFAVTLKPLAVGNATVSIGQFPGGFSPVTAAQLAVKVTEPGALISPFTLGVDLQAPVQARVGNGNPTPASDLLVPVYASAVVVSATPSASGSYYLSATIPAGQRISTPFYVQATQPGSASVTTSSNGVNSTAAVTVTKTAFVFQEAVQSRQVAVNSGSNASVTVIPALSTPAANALAPLSIRPGAKPVVNVTSSNSSILKVAASQVTLNPGDQQAVVSITGVAPGEATLTLSGATYDFSQPQSSIVVTVR